MKRVETSVSIQQFAEMTEFCEKHGLSVYALVKKALLHYIRSESLPPGTEEMTERESHREPEKVVEKEKVVSAITYIKRKGDRATNMIIHEWEISVTATNPDDVERLFKFVKEETKDLEKKE